MNLWISWILSYSCFYFLFLFVSLIISDFFWFLKLELLVGLGYGSADLPKEAKPLDAKSAVEFALCVGMYYTVIPNIDVSAELYRRAVVVDFTNSGLSDATVATAVNGLEFGVNYHF